MAAITWQGLTGLVRQQIAVIQASANAAVDSSDGSVTLAIVQAVSSVALWLQAQIAQVIALTRAATSVGSDLDTWMADWFFTRLPPVEAVGVATFSRFTPTLQAVVQIGSLISTGPGGSQYIVTLDSSNPNYSAGLNGYVLAPSVASIDAPISATVAGAAANVLAGTIISFVQPITGVDAVTNSNALTTGADAESDTSFRSRFRDYIASLRRATPAAIRAAVLAIQQGLTCVVLENVLPNGTAQNGFLTIVVDDGTGAPATPLLNAAGSAVDAVRAAGIQFNVTAPTIISVAIVMTVQSIDDTLHADDTAAAQASVTSYVNSLPVGAPLVWSRLYQLAFDASSNISGVIGITINGGTADIVPTATQIVKTSSVVVN